MDNKFRIIMVVLLVVFLTSLAAAFGGIFDDGDLTTQNILVCPVDDNGACNLAFLVTVENGAISSYTPVFTDGMAHATATNDANEKLSFKDVFALSDKQQALDYAKEIYEANNDGVTVDAVATVDSQTINDVISAAGTLKDGENVITPTATDILNADPNFNVVNNADFPIQPSPARVAIVLWGNSNELNSPKSLPSLFFVWA